MEMLQNAVDFQEELDQVGKSPDEDNLQVVRGRVRLCVLAYSR